MENYDQFVQRRLSELRNVEEKPRPSPAPSLIRFHGQPILPPLVLEECREQIQRHREAAQKYAARRSVNKNQRLAHVETILRSVQLRSTPTLEDLLQELKIGTKSSHLPNILDEPLSQSKHSAATKDNLSFSPPPVMCGTDAISFPPLASTAYGGFFTSDVTPQQENPEGSTTDRRRGQNASHSSSPNDGGRLTQSSGYVTHQDMGNTTSASGTFGEEREGLDATGNFFLLNTSDTIAKMPNITNHPPMDGEELERSGMESPAGNDFDPVKDVFNSLLLEDLVVCEHFPVERAEESYLGCGEKGDEVSAPTVPETDQRDHSDTTLAAEVPVLFLENTGSSDSSDSPKVVSTEQCPATEWPVQHNTGETELSDDWAHRIESEPPKEPDRLSLQALLKKSQEYRHRQRMLRNQAKNAKVHGRAQQQPRMEEQSLSDKENDEFPNQGTVTAEGKKHRERKGTFILSAEMPVENNSKNQERGLIWKRVSRKSEGQRVAGAESVAGHEDETTLKNNRLNISQEVTADSKQTAFLQEQQSLLKETSPTQEALQLITLQDDFCPPGSSKVGGKYDTIPAPNFCRSPVHCRSRSCMTTDGTELSQGMILICSNSDREADTDHDRCQSCRGTLDRQAVESGVISALAKNSQHIDQLEWSLSSLRELISDLECTLTESLEGQSQADSRPHTEPCFQSMGQPEPIQDQTHDHLCESDCKKLEDTRGEDSHDSERDQRGSECQRRQSFDTSDPEQNSSEHDSSYGSTDNEPCSHQAVNLEISACRDGSTQWSGYEDCKKRQLPAKCILSVAQRMRIPDVFRNVPSEPPFPDNISVLSEASNHLVERKHNSMQADHDSPHQLSLNQSFDVDTPSGLWLLDGSGLSSQENQMTPGDDAGSEGRASGVKRKLIMHGTEETPDRGTDTGGGSPGSVVRPDSSTPRAAWCEGNSSSQGDKQEQLKEFRTAQIRALQAEHRKQQEELLQALATRYSLLRSVSFPCPTSGSRLGDTSTFPTLSQPSSSLPGCCRPLLLAAVKGFLTRRLLRTERVAQLVRTVGDTQRFLQAFEQQSPGRGEVCSRQDLLLRQRVGLQLRAARHEVHDIFFHLPIGAKMQLISWDRELARERERRRQGRHPGGPKGKTSLSAATQKSLQRKRGMMIQKRATETHRGIMGADRKVGLSARQPQEPKPGRVGENRQRVPKSTNSSRPR